MHGVKLRDFYRPGGDVNGPSPEARLLRALLASPTGDAIALAWMDQTADGRAFEAAARAAGAGHIINRALRGDA